MGFSLFHSPQGCHLLFWLHRQIRGVNPSLPRLRGNSSGSFRPSQASLRRGRPRDAKGRLAAGAGRVFHAAASALSRHKRGGRRRRKRGGEAALAGLSSSLSRSRGTSRSLGAPVSDELRRELQRPPRFCSLRDLTAQAAWLGLRPGEPLAGSELLLPPLSSR